MWCSRRRISRAVCAGRGRSTGSFSTPRATCCTCGIPGRSNLWTICCPVNWRKRVRKAEIRSRGATLPFPFQANLHGLPPDFVERCIVDFRKTLGRDLPDDPATSFEDWSLAVFGRGISEAFMFPYNEKLFRREAAEMTADWVSWAVPKPTLEEVVRGAAGVPNTGMGYNATFRYPTSGGIGVLPAALAGRVKNLRCGCPVVAVDLDLGK